MAIAGLVTLDYVDGDGHFDIELAFDSKGAAIGTEDFEILNALPEMAEFVEFMNAYLTAGDTVVGGSRLTEWDNRTFLLGPYADSTTSLVSVSAIALTQVASDKVVYTLNIVEGTDAGQIIQDWFDGLSDEVDIGQPLDSVRFAVDSHETAHDALTHFLSETVSAQLPQHYAALGNAIIAEEWTDAYAHAVEMVHLLGRIVSHTAAREHVPIGD